MAGRPVRVGGSTHRRVCSIMPSDRRTCPLPLAAPARYSPWDSGRYEVKVGYVRFGTELGNGAADRFLCQLDREFPRYRSAKLAARSEALGKYYGVSGLREPVARAVAELLRQRLCADYPEWFHRQGPAGPGQTLVCALTGETLGFREDGALERSAEKPVTPGYADALDALACQVQEDLAVVQCEAGGADRVAALHACFPNHWSPREKLGKSFPMVHQPVPGMERIHRSVPALVRDMVERGPYVRFAWGLAADRRLNHHPDPPPGRDPLRWRGRRFRPAARPWYLRVERQVVWGLPQVEATLFTIRTYFVPCADLRDDPAQRRRLAAAITSMAPAALAYKGLAEAREDLLHWLRG